jgi:hypothetical protein
VLRRERSAIDNRITLLLDQSMPPLPRPLARYHPDRAAVATDHPLQLLHVAAFNEVVQKGQSAEIGNEETVGRPVHFSRSRQ